jgi:hypothetical protein
MIHRTEADGGGRPGRADRPLLEEEHRRRVADPTQQRRVEELMTKIAIGHDAPEVPARVQDRQVPDVPAKHLAQRLVARGVDPDGHDAPVHNLVDSHGRRLRMSRSGIDPDHRTRQALSVQGVQRGCHRR